ncbi:MAG TPA: hypothetical protein VJV78_17420 [Polyangiales bacterium]|nr:hypothetical protein [Polyangiales bacterium]
MKALRVCEGCERHVFVSERVCPFCLSELAPAAPRARLPIPSGASRAQRLAMAAAAAVGTTGLLACGEPELVAVPVYGAPLAGNQAVQPPAAGSPAAGRGAQPAAGRGAPAQDGGIGSPVYGAPSPVYGAPVYGAPLAGQPAPPPKRPDAGIQPEDDAGIPDPGVAGTGGRGGMPAPVYGAPIPEYGAPPPPKD